MAKGKLISESEKQTIACLFKTIGNVRKVARTVGRDPAAIRKIIRSKADKSLFNWKDFNNSII